jgi:hypothetical protein
MNHRHPSIAPDSSEVAALQLTLDDIGLVRSGDILITVWSGESLVFVWRDFTAYGLMVDSSLGGSEPTLWEIQSTTGFSSVVAFAQTPAFAEQVAPPLPLVRGRHYFVSVYGEHPRYGIQEFVF